MLHSDKDRVFACQGADNFRNNRRINFHCHARSQTRLGSRYHQILATQIQAKQSARRATFGFWDRVMAPMLYNAQLFEVTRQARLRGWETSALKRIAQLGLVREGPGAHQT